MLFVFEPLYSRQQKIECSLSGVLYSPLSISERLFKEEVLTSRTVFLSPLRALILR